MNELDDELLKNLKIYCPPSLITKYSHKHKIPNDWIRFYYYKNKQRKECGPDNIAFDYEVSSMSSDDNYFDYFFKLKADLPKCVVKKCNRYGKSEKQKKMKMADWRNPPKNPPEISDDGKFVCRFN